MLRCRTSRARSSDVPGVEDAVVFLPDADARPAAAVVAPGLTAEAILRELRAHLDGVFVPRPLVIVGEIAAQQRGQTAARNAAAPARAGALMNSTSSD